MTDGPPPGGDVLGELTALGHRPQHDSLRPLLLHPHTTGTRRELLGVLRFWQVSGQRHVGGTEPGGLYMVTRLGYTRGHNSPLVLGS